MKTHTSNFKNQIKQFGKEIDSKITYIVGSEEIELGNEELNSITPHYEGAILKSVMKQLDIDSNEEIPEGTIINYQFGLKVGNSYEYLNFGNYVVYKVEKQEDTNSYKITCYDKMLYSMVDYETMSITYPITIKNYLTALCSKIGLTLKSGHFANEDKLINIELYLDSDGNSLDYTFRDVLDEIAQATGSTICINEETDELEVRYINNTGTQTTQEGTNISIANSDDEKLDLTLQGNTTQNTTTGKNLYAYGDYNVNTTYYFKEQLLLENYENNTTYTLSFDINVNETPFNISVGYGNTGYARDMREMYSLTNGHNSITFTTNNANYTNLYFRCPRYSTSGTQRTGTVSNIQLEKGSQATSYEPYTNGASPNPDYPQPINVVSGEQTFTTSNENETKTYKINLGKNLLSCDLDRIKSYNTNGTWTNNVYEWRGITTTVNENGTTTIKGTTGSSVFVYYYYVNTANKMLRMNAGTYTFSTNTGAGTGNIVIGFRDLDGNAISGVNTIYFGGDNSATATRTINQDFQMFAYIQINANLEVSERTIELQVEKGSIASSFSPYKTPIELCKIGTYKDRIFKLEGKNLFDINGDRTGGAYYTLTNGTIKIISATTSAFIYWNDKIDIKTSNYTFMLNLISTEARPLLKFYDSDENVITNLSLSGWTYNSFYGGYWRDITTIGNNIFNLALSNNVKKVQIGFVPKTLNGEFNNIYFGTTTTTYEPYGEKGTWYLQKSIDKVVLNGTEDGWNVRQGNNPNLYIFYLRNNAVADGKKESGGFSNYFIENTTSGLIQYDGGFRITEYNAVNIVFLCVNSSIATTIPNFKTWLSTHNTELYYPLATPTYTEITDSELLGQLNAPRLFEGLNNVSVSSADLGSPIKITYTSQLDTIDEEYLKDINVNFGEKFGKVNSIVLSRSAESDNVYIQDEASVLENGLCEIKIKDNQIMNDNNRADFLPELLEKLDGLEYYINDFASPGIVYYNLCDKYKVKVRDNYYKCILFNDEVNITQGLEENIHTDMPEETETDYTYASKDDRTINKAYIIAKKNEAEIEALASKVVDVSNTISGINSITLENAYEGILHRLEITGNLTCLFPSESLEPSEDLYPIDTVLDVDEEKYILDIDYLQYINDEDCDKYVYEDGKQWIERRNGTIEEKEDLTINVSKESVITLEHFNGIKLTCLYLLDNEYTSTFANQVEVSSELKLLADTFEAKVSQVADDDGNITSASIILAVNNDESSAEIQANKINLNGLITANGNFKILQDGSMETKNAKFSGLINGGAISITGGFTETDPYIEVEHPDSTGTAPIDTRIWSNGISCCDYSSGGMPIIRTENNDGFAQMVGSEVDAFAFNNISLESQKKDFERFDKALDIISSADIYKYHYKAESKENKKHIGLVISNGKKNYNTPDEIISSNGKGIDLYAMISTSWKAIKELKEENDNLKEEINKLKKEMK